jgi:hypothetical protein
MRKKGLGVFFMLASDDREISLWIQAQVVSLRPLPNLRYQTGDLAARSIEGHLIPMRYPLR